MWSFVTTDAGDKILFFNAEGILFYTKMTQLAQQAILATATVVTMQMVKDLLILNRLQLLIRPILVLARAAYSMVGTELASDAAVAGMLADEGFD